MPHTADLPRLSARLPIQVIVGEADVISPPAVNLEIAAGAQSRRLISSPALATRSTSRS
jgi:hypothetical protein